MACFLVSTAEAAAIEAVRRHEVKMEAEHPERIREDKVLMSTKLGWLRNLLLGGAVLLLFEHIWHGEVVPWFPFLSAMKDPGDMMAMLKEMGTVGVCMAVAITLVWAVICKVADMALAKDSKEVKA